MTSVQLDGFLNSTVFCWEDAVYALGRASDTGPLKMCTVHPEVRHVAVIPQPPDSNLEDPRYLGVFDGKIAFLCADGMEYYTKRGQHRIYQTVLYIDPSTWQAAGCWRLDGDYAGAAEKNWTPLGDMEGDVSVVLYSHMSGRQLAIDHRRRTVEDRPSPGVDSARALDGVRGGTPLLRQEDGTWRGFGHRVGGIRNTSGYMKWYNYDFNINQYLGTVHHYSADLRTVLSERELPIWRGAVIHYPCGLADLGGGAVLASIGIDDCSTIFVHLSSLESDTILPSTIECRCSYLSDHIPRPLAQGRRQAATPTICLNMIVKNEEKIIERLLRTVTPMVDSYCICDTGSTDGTVDLIRQHFAAAGVPGRLVEYPFVSFGYNRSFALRAAQDLADYVLLLDADMKLVVDPAFDKTTLTADVYTIEQGNSDFSYRNVRLLRTDAQAECVGSTHEYYSYPGRCRTEHLTTLRIEDVGDGGCKDNKFERDIRLLKGDLTADPNNERAHFYLANSFRDTGRWDEAIRHYRRRIELGGWDEEVWYSRYSQGKCHREAGDADEALRVWLEAFEHYPRRIENLYEIILHYRLAGKNELAARYYDWARSVPKPNDSLFLHHNIYDYLMDYEFVIVYYYLRDKSRYPADALPQAVLNLMKHGYNLPSVLSNYKFYAPALSSLPGYRRRALPLDDAVRALAPETPLESTPSSVRLPDGDRLINVRFNNTVLTKDWQYLLQDGREITRNVCLRTSPDGTVVRSAHLLPDPPPCEDANIFVGRQDIRLFAGSGCAVRYTATVCRRENERKVFRIEYGTYDGDSCSGTCLRSPCDAECEKNWSLYKNNQGQVRCVYSWHPVVRGRLEGENFVEEHRFEVPELRLARGSSHGVWHRGELWFLVHIVSYEEPRRYYHALVVLDPEMRQVRRLSTLFTLQGEPIEYCGGLAIEDERAVLHCSVRDHSSEEVSVPLASLSWRTLA